MPRLRYLLTLAVLLAPGLLAQTTSQPFTLVDDPAITARSVFSYGPTWVDIDGDLDLDLYLGNPSTAFAGGYFRNEGDGTFTDLLGTAEAGDLLDNLPASSGQSWADIDNDGDLDACTAGAPVSSIYRNDDGRLVRISGATATNAGFGGDPSTRGWSCAWGDYDNDGLVDLFIAHPAGFVLPAAQPIGNTLYRNVGNGGFVRVDDTPITDGLAPYTVGRWMDYDTDGDQDLFIGSGPANGTIARDFLYRNLLTETGTASFERIEDDPLDEARDGQTWNVIDYDNDGDLDAYVTNYGNFANDLYRNDGGTFVPIGRGTLVDDRDASLANVWGDYDNDGDLDVFVVNEQGQPARFYRNNGAPTFSFTETGAFSDLTMGIYGAAAGDYDNDGDLDLIAVPVLPVTFGAAFANKLYRNNASEADAPGGWLKLKLDGTTSNRAGLGAVLRAEVTIGGVAQTLTREVSAQNTFNGHSSLVVHFGLGDAAQIDRLTIAWPSGMEDVFENVAPNRFVIAEEGGGLTPVTSEPVTPPSISNRLTLDDAYPNPSTASVSIRYVLPEAGAVTLVVYDLLGRQVAKLVDAPMASGTHTVTWNGTDAAGQRLGAG
ncbi:MAG: FG-GAP-like repeat-containing protein, partial [Bacteroidota bacterium]